jgi:hypothetical protein
VKLNPSISELDSMTDFDRWTRIIDRVEDLHSAFDHGFDLKQVMRDKWVRAAHLQSGEFQHGVTI